MNRHVSALLVSIATLTMIAPVQAQDKKGVNYAFLVACSGYDKTQLRELPYTINDIEEFKKALITTGFAEENIKVLHDKQSERRYHSERSKILKELKLLLAGVKPEDTLAIALSGHGVHFKGDKTGYFCPLDAELEDKATLIPMDGTDGLFELLKACKAKRKLLIINACRNDPASDVSQAAKKVQLDDEDVEQVPEGIAALYSCQQGQKSYFDPKRQRGIFFDHVIRAWQGEYLEGNEKLTLESVFTQVVAKTKADADKTFAVAQVPVVRREYQGNWIVNGIAKPIVFPGEDKFQAGLKYFYGFGTKIDDKQAVASYREAITAGHPLAKVGLAICYFEGRGVVVDAEKGKELCQFVGSEVRKAAERQQPIAQYYLGYLSTYGLGVEQNLKEALKWYREAANRNHPVAQVELGNWYRYGWEVKKDVKEAFQWYQKAADQNLALGQIMVGDCHQYEAGIGLDKTARDPAKWYRKAVDQGLPAAYGRLASILRYAGGEREEYYRLYRKGVELDDFGAQREFGQLLGTFGDLNWKKDLLEGFNCLLKAAEKGDSLSMFYVGQAYQSGIKESNPPYAYVLRPNLPEAIRWWRKAAALEGSFGSNLSKKELELYEK